MPTKTFCATRTLIIIGVVAVLIAIIVTTGVLLGIFLVTDSKLEIVKFTKQRNENQYQDVVDDPNTNVVEYHVHDGDQDAWIVNDFNRDIETMKLRTKDTTNCFLTALNRTIALTPSEIKGPESFNPNQTVSFYYRYTNSPIPDTSFLHETAQKLCKGVSVYWLYPQIGPQVSSASQQSRQSQMSRRQADSSGRYSITYIDKFTTRAWFCVILCWG